jgi:hypothetical protein
MVNKDLQDLIIYIFQEGLSEDAYYRSYPEISLQDMIDKSKSIPNNSLESILVDLLIKDIEYKIKYSC